MKNIKLSQAQTLLIGGLWSILAAAASASMTSAIQAYTTGGINVPVLINVALAAFGAVFIPQTLSYVPAHIQLILQSGEDAYTALSQTHIATVQALNAVSAIANKQNVQAPAQSVQSTPVQTAYNPHVSAAQQYYANQAPVSQVSQAQYTPQVSNSPVNTVDVASMNTQNVSSINLPVDAMGNIPQNSLAALAGSTATVTGQFRIAGVSNLSS